MEAGWSATRVARQLSHSDCVVRRCWDQWIREMSFIRKPDSGRSRQTSRREDRLIVRNEHVQPTPSSAAIQAQIEPSLGAPVSSRTTRRHLAEEHLESWRPHINGSVWSGAAHEKTGLQWNATRSCLATRIQIQSQQ
ncbi:transposable element Tcb2 transposase [Trichonephila clavipes]|nr:transposable element Tcb2 transposase [Trichonephila clavipes]